MGHGPRLRDQEPPGRPGGRGHRDGAGDDDVGLPAPLGGAEPGAVAVDAAAHPVPVAQVPDDHRQAGTGGDGRSLAHGQHERRHGQPLRGTRVHARGRGAPEPAEQLGQLRVEVLRVVLVPAQRPAHAVGEAHRAAEPHVDPAGEERLQDAELLGDDQRPVVGQHHAPGAHADAVRGPGHGGGEDGRRRPGHAGHAVVLRHPEPVVAEPLRLPCQLHRVAQRLPGAVARPDAGAVEDGEAGGGEC